MHGVHMKTVEEIIALIRLDGMSHTYSRASSKTGYVRATIFDFDSLVQDYRRPNNEVYKVSAFGQNKEEALRNAFEEHNIMFPKWKEKHARR
jgi:hypothetical protein